MEEYLRYMRRQDTVRIFKILLCSGICVMFFCTIAFLNTRFNGFADVHDAAYYFAKVQSAWRSICETLFLFPYRFINFFI